MLNQTAYQLEFHGLDFENDFGINDHKGSCEGMLRTVLQSFQASTDYNRAETLQSSLIPADLFYHGFTTRQGGVSTYPTMQSFSLMFSSRKKDTMVFVKENRRRLAQACGFDFSQFQVRKACIFSLFRGCTFHLYRAREMVTELCIF